MATMSGLGLVGAVFSTLLWSLTLSKLASALDSPAVAAPTFYDATATYYGGYDASGTMNGACGYTNPFSLGYGSQTVALSTPLFNNGLTCGACFEVKCKRSASAYAQKWCYPSVGSVIVTATNLCPPGSNGGWCDPPKRHFDMAYAVFTRLANQVAGVIPIQYRRVRCHKPGGIKFTLNGNTYWNLVLVSNVAGAGNVNKMEIKGSMTGFVPMRQNWGQNWESYQKLVGQNLSFRVTLGNGRTVTFWNVAPETWRFGQTVQASYNF